MKALCLLVFVVFLVLKLTGITDNWSWGFVLLPAAVWWGAIGRESEIEKALKRDLSDVGS